MKRLSEAGVRIGVGTDGGGQQGDQFLGWTMHAELENLVMAGSLRQRCWSATRMTAEILGQTIWNDPRAGPKRRLRRARRKSARGHHQRAFISKVFIRGREIDRDGLRARLMNVAP